MMDESWRAETRRVIRSFDAVADLYREEFGGELDRKPFDRQFLADAAARLRADESTAPVLEVGAGPGHVGRFLADHGISVIVSDGSTGQVHQARTTGPNQPLVVCDLARLPTRPGALAGILAFYCLIYGPARQLDAVFEDWRRALVPGGLVILAVHVGEGTIDVDEWRGRSVDLSVVLRDPDDLLRRLADSGLVVEQKSIRPSYEDEHPTDRMYVAARRSRTP